VPQQSELLAKQKRSANCCVLSVKYWSGVLLPRKTEREREREGAQKASKTAYFVLKLVLWVLPGQALTSFILPAYTTFPSSSVESFDTAACCLRREYIAHWVREGGKGLA
ncbi:unnamed protein product, partial [Ectocarpus sp. 12 AP-2014]